ncbi:MAG: rod shape-determining protein MreC [Oscillospiraceae bacterium]|nr:rod shape-determining protein MreC [Oscillospiraceae bacterium]
MKKYFTTRLRVVLVLAVLAALITIGSMFLWPGKAGVLNNAVSVVLNPVKNGVTLLVDKAERLYNYLFGYELLQAENEQLQAELANMNQDIRDAQTYKTENERLRELENLTEKHTDYDLAIANVVSRSGGSYGSTMTISQGSSIGLEAGMCAITETGQVVGILSEVGTNWATVTTILDTTSEIGAYIFGSGYTCIAQGDFTLMKEGKLRASYLSSSATIRNSDQLLTSGDGDIYPPGLVIGGVTDVGDDETNVAKYAVITPTVDLDAVEQVFVIKSYDIKD